MARLIMAIIEINKLSFLVKQRDTTHESIKYLSNVCFMFLTDHHNIMNMFNHEDLEFLINHCDLTGYSRLYGCRWGTLHWVEQNKIALSDITKNFLLHSTDLSGTDNNGNTILFHAIKPQSYFNSMQIDYILHHCDCNVINLLGDRALNYYLYNNYNSLNEEQLNYLFRHTHYLPTHPYNNPLRSFITAKNNLTEQQMDILLNMPHNWGSSYHNETLIENVLICILKEKASALFLPEQMTVIIEKSIDNIQEALVMMSFFSRVNNLSQQSSRKLEECLQLYNLIKQDPEITLPAFSQYCPNLPLSLSKNLHLDIEDSIIMAILTKTLIVIDEFYLFSEKIEDETLLERIKHMFFHTKSHNPIITPAHSRDYIKTPINKKPFDNNLQ